MIAAEAERALFGVHDPDDGGFDRLVGIRRRQVLQAELCHFVSGHAFFTPENGEKFEIKAGDAVFFPPNSRGVWDVRETIRKTYVTFNP